VENNFSGKTYTKVIEVAITTNNTAT